MLLLTVVLATLAAPIPVLADPGDPDPFPAGACLKVTVVNPKPTCVFIDPRN